jgi:hypothetical protein
MAVSFHAVVFGFSCPRLKISSKHGMNMGADAASSLNEKAELKPPQTTSSASASFAWCAAAGN